MDIMRKNVLKQKCVTVILAEKKEKNSKSSNISIKYLI